MEHKERLYLQLPNGQALIACKYGDEEYPSIDIYVENSEGKQEKLCFVELNHEREPGKEICIGVYAPDEEEPVYYESYVEGMVL